MTTKKALQLEFLIEYETRMHNAMENPSKSWNIGNDSIKKLAGTLSDCHRKPPSFEFAQKKNLFQIASIQRR